MLYLTGCIPKKPHLRQLLLDNDFGSLVTPFSVRTPPSDEWVWAADNGCFASRWTEKVWLDWLDSKSNPSSALFATVPDVVADHSLTLERWYQYAPMVIERGFKPAFVLQDGAKLEELPFDTMGSLFIGGTTEYKLSREHC